jgi:ABC-type branched-subunit amino acid transport system ATPase component/ABC-type branched-subunit amino acid transport system permease subunit
VSARDLAGRTWDHPVVGRALRLLGGYVLVVEVVLQLWLGRIDVPWLDVPWLEVGLRGSPVPRGVFLQGAAIGTLYALVAMGLILVYRANRVISFAQAQLGAVPASLALLLMVRKGLPYPLAIGIVVIGGGLLGGAVEVGVVRRFQRSSRLILTVVTVGIGFLLLFAEYLVKKSVTGRIEFIDTFPTPFRDAQFNVGIVRFTADSVVALAVAIACVVGLGAFLRFTDIGVAVRAAADDSERATTLGIPVRRLSTVVWVVAGVLSAVGVFLRAPIVGLPVVGFVGPSLLLFGLTAAVIARMDSLSMALVGGMLVGVIDQTAQFSTGRASLASGVMLVVVLAALLLQKVTTSRTGELDASSWQTVADRRPLSAALDALPAVRDFRAVVAVVLVAAAIAFPLLVSESVLDVTVRAALCAIIGVSLVVLTGWTGQISLGQFAVAGVGAAVAGGLAADHGWDFFAALAAGAAAGALASVVIGLPAVRIPGLFYAVTTLAFAFAVQNVLLNREYAGWLLPDDLAFVERPVLYGRIDVTSQHRYYLVCMAFLGLTLALASALRRNRSGRVLLTVRDAARLGQAFGIDPVRTRLAAFAVSGAIAGLAGALFAFEQGSVDSATFSPEVSIQLFVMVVIGGIGSLPGAVLGAAFVFGVPELPGLREIDQVEFLVSGLGVVLVLALLPDGLAGGVERIRDWFVARLPGAADVEAELAHFDEPATALDGDQPSARVSDVGREDALLRCEGVCAGYGPVQVLFGVDLEVSPGEVVALLGTNGAGKSTLLRAVSGVLPPSSGRVTLGGEDVTRLDPARTAALGIAQVPGGRAVFPSLTVSDNLRAAAWLRRSDKAAVREAELRVLDLFPRLAERAETDAGDLSGGERQQLGLAMALLERPRLLLIDELSLGLAPSIVSRLLDVVRELAAQGTAVLIVEQSVNVALTVADRAYFMEKGEVRFTGPTSELLGRGDLVRSVFLDNAVATGLARSRAEEGRLVDVGGAVVLELSSLGKRYGGVRAVEGVDLVVHEGETVGVIGPNGAGKTTIFDLVCGYTAIDEGRVVLDGHDITHLPAHRRARLGLGRSFQDARLVPSLTVAEVLALALDRHLPVRDHLASALNLPEVVELEDRVSLRVDDLIDLFGLGPYRESLVRELSTGTRRVVDLAMTMVHYPSVLLLDEPSSGIAQRETEALVPLLRQIQGETGCALLVIEHDIALVTSISDRLVAMDLGRVVATGAPADVLSHPLVLSAYLGDDAATVHRSGALAP